MSTALLKQQIQDAIELKVSGALRHWNSFWFTPADPAALAAVRILTGLVLLYVHTTSLPLCLDAVGPEGWIDAHAWNALKRLDPGYGCSLYSAVQSTAAICVLHGLFLAAIGCLTVGLASRPAALLVWLGQLSYVQRGFPLTYGLDGVAAFLTLYLVIGPCGGTWSVDTWLSRRRVGFGRAAPLPDQTPSIAANVAVRCIQIHMCIVYLFAGLAKLQGSLWWSGLATYYAAMSPEMWPMPYRVGWIGEHPELVEALANLTVLFTLAFEISFAFLIWNRGFRPLLLAAAIVLHAGIGLLLGLGAFSLMMLAGCMAFVPPDSWRFISRRMTCPQVPYSRYR